MKSLLANILAIAMVTGLSVSCQGRGKYVAISGYAQGGTYTVKISTKGVAMTPQAIKVAIDSILLEIDNSLSGYNKASQLSRLNAGESIKPSELLCDMYAQAYRFWEETEGALDFAAGELYNLWGFGFTGDSLPSPSQVQMALDHGGMKQLKSAMEPLEDGSFSSIMLDRDGTGDVPTLNFNAIAQGYSCDVVAGWLRTVGVRDMLVDIGEIFCDGLNPGGRPWSIGVDTPYDGNDVPGQDLSGIWQSDGGPCGIVTSGNYRKYYIKDGKKYSHTIDPRTGYPTTHNLLSATIVARNATLADAYATYCMVIGPEEAMTFIESRDDLEGMLIMDEKGEMKIWVSPGFRLKDPMRQ